MKDKICAVLPVAAAFASRFPVSCRVFAPVTVVGQGVEAFVHLEDQVAAPAAVAAVRTAVRNIQLPPETAVAVAALAGPDIYLCSVSEHNVSFSDKGL